MSVCKSRSAWLPPERESATLTVASPPQMQMASIGQRESDCTLLNVTFRPSCSVAEAPDRKSNDWPSGMSVGWVGLPVQARLRLAIPTARTVRTVWARIRLGSRASTIPRYPVSVSLRQRLSRLRPCVSPTPALLRPRTGTSRTLAEEHVRRALAGNVPVAFIPERTQIDAVQQMLSCAQEDRTDGQMQLVDQTGAQILANRRDPTADTNVAPCCRELCLGQGGVDALRHESEHGAARHGEGRSR